MTERLHELTFEDLCARARRLAADVIDADSLAEADLLVTRELCTVYHAGENHAVDLLNAGIDALGDNGRRTTMTDHPTFPHPRKVEGHRIIYGNRPLFLGDDTDPNPENPGVLEPIDETHAAVKKPNGQYLSLAPNGTYGESASIGDYERFVLDDKYMLFGAQYTQSDGSAAGVPVKLWVCYAGA